MNRGVFHSSPVQQMMVAGNTTWWPNINNLMRPPLMSTPHHHHHQQQQLSHPDNNNNNSNNNNDDISIFQAPYSMNNLLSQHSSSSSWLLDDQHTNNNQEHHQLPESWSQLLLGGVCMEDQDQVKKMESWVDQQVVLQQQQQQQHHHQTGFVDVKQESSVDSYSNNINSNVYNNQDQEFQLSAASKANTNWSQMNNIPASSPQSCVTTFSSSNSLLDFSSTKSVDPSSECNSTATGGATKKPKVQPSSTQTTFKVRKEKLGDRITALHQLVSPFGKTDTASVLLEAIGYIRFLQSQIEALSLPYLSNGAGNKRQPQPVQGERNCIFPEDPGQLLDDNGLKRKRGPEQDSYEEPKKDLRSRGLCLVPLSCTLQVGSDNGADYWAPALGGGFR